MEEIKKYQNAIDIYKNIKEKRNYRNVAICGMGGSAIAGDYVKEIFEEKNVVVVRDFKLPKFIDKNYLCICISYSGNTEETISCLNDALKRNLDIVSITSNGRLEKICKEKGIYTIKLPKGYQPRFAFPYILISLISLLDKRILNDIERFLKEINVNEHIILKISKNIYDKPLTIICYNKYFPVAYRFKSQLNENAKHVTRIELIPEMNHNEIETYYNDIGENFLFIIGKDEDEKIMTRISYVKNLIRKNSVGKIVEIYGNGNYLNNLIYFTIILDLVSLKVAEIKNINPYKITNIEELKKFLATQHKTSASYIDKS